MEEKIKTVIKETFDDIIAIFRLQSGKNGCPKSKLRFPYKYKDGEGCELRISEQELRCLFIEKLKEHDLYYNIEAPTIGDYRFDSKDGKMRSGNFDLVICDETGKKRFALIEFKGLNPDTKCYAKDYWKLRDNREQGELRYFLQVVKNANDKTYKNITKKIASIDSFVQKRIFNVDKHNLIGEVIYRCVCLEDGAEITQQIKIQ